MDRLSACGNKVATKRLADIRQMCAHLNIDLDWEDLAVNPTPAAGLEQEKAVPWVGSAGRASPREVVPAWQPAEAGRGLSVDMLSFSPGEMDVAAFWDGGGLSLDGTFETDWQEFERIMSQF